MLLELEPTDVRLGLRGLAALVPSGDAWMPYRLPETLLPLAHPELLQRVSMPAGGRFCFATDARGFELAVRTAVPETPERVEVVSPFDVLLDGELHSRQSVAGGGSVVVEGLEPRRRRVEVWFPQFGEVELGRFRLDGATVIEAAIDPGSRWIVYGSSITQCKASAGPSETWPALAARSNGWDLRCLGFSAQCHLDPIVACAIRDTPAELIQLCVGINIYGAGTFSARSLGPALAGFIQTIRQGHPSTPLVVTTPIIAPARETVPNAVGMTLRDIRDIIEGTVLVLRDLGDEALHLIDGPSILGPADTGLLSDGLHPTGAGYRLMAERLGPRLRYLAGPG
jgi:hypothetical protein